MQQVVWLDLIGNAQVLVFGQQYYGRSIALCGSWCRHSIWTAIRVDPNSSGSGLWASWLGTCWDTLWSWSIGVVTTLGYSLLDWVPRTV